MSFSFYPVSFSFISYFYHHYHSGVVLAIAMLKHHDVAIRIAAKGFTAPGFAGAAGVTLETAIISHTYTIHPVHIPSHAPETPS